MELSRRLLSGAPPSSALVPRPRGAVALGVASGTVRQAQATGTNAINALVERGVAENNNAEASIEQLRKENEKWTAALKAYSDELVTLTKELHEQQAEFEGILTQHTLLDEAMQTTTVAVDAQKMDLANEETKLAELAVKREKIMDAFLEQGAKFLAEHDRLVRAGAIAV